MSLINLLDNGGFTRWNQGTAFPTPADSSETADGWIAQNLSAGASAVDQISAGADVDSGLFSIQVDDDDATSVGRVEKIIPNPENYRGKTITVIARVKQPAGDTTLVNARLRVEDSVGSNQDSIALSTSFQFISVTRVVDAGATSLAIHLRCGTGNSEVGPAIWDSILLLEGDWSSITDYQYIEALLTANDIDSRITVLDAPFHGNDTSAGDIDQVGEIGPSIVIAADTLKVGSLLVMYMCQGDVRATAATNSVTLGIQLNSVTQDSKIMEVGSTVAADVTNIKVPFIMIIRITGLNITIANTIRVRVDAASGATGNINMTDHELNVTEIKG